MTRPATQAQEQNALQRLFGVGELPEVVVLPLPLLREIGRRVRPTKPLDDEEETKTPGP